MAKTKEPEDVKAEGQDGRGSGEERDFSYTQNREVSWLRFDERVLDEAFDETVPLFERLTFVSIFSSNLDEWFMIRIGGLSDLALLKHQPRDNKSDETPQEQIEAVLGMLPAFIKKQEEAFDTIEEALSHKGLRRVRPEEATDADLAAMDRFFESTVSPILSPLVVDPRHPFPNLRNQTLYVVCSLAGTDGEQGLLGIVEIPSALPRVMELPSTDQCWRYVLLEDLVISRLQGMFGSFQPSSPAVIRVTRNADIDPDGEGVEEEEDYRQHMKKVLKKRQRLQPVRLEVQGTLDDATETYVREELNLAPLRVFHTTMPLDPGYIFGLEGHIPSWSRPELTYEPFAPQISPMVDEGRPMREQVEDHDILLLYPYESMDPLLRLLREASSDDDCISIKITLYRVAKQSRLCESLIAAAENGKEVTVLMELRARFDEANNIAWAERLEDAGCTVIYGSEGYKVHSKICQITYHDKARFSRITCLGTGNFNEKTAKLYSDFMLMTAHEGIGNDGNTFFRNLSIGNLNGSYKYLGVAPMSLKPLVMRGLDREISRARKGEPAQVFMKMNSLTDRDVIDKISEACEAGVHVILIVRGICCIRANVPGKTDGLVVREIVGRFLEHARCYAFGVNVDTLYLSSADMMTRNTERRVEIAYPVLDPTCRALAVATMNIQLADNTKARQLTADGTWEKVARHEGDPDINSQELLLALAYRRAHAGSDDAAMVSPLSKIYQRLSREDVTRLVELPAIGTYAAKTMREKAPDLAKRAAKAADTMLKYRASRRAAEGEAVAKVAVAAAEDVAAQLENAKVEVAQDVSLPASAPSLTAQAKAGEAQPATEERVAEATAEAAPQPAPAPVTAAPTQAPASTAPTPAATPALKPTATPAPAHQGRVSHALGLIGAGFRELFGGR